MKRHWPWQHRWAILMEHWEWDMGGGKKRWAVARCVICGKYIDRPMPLRPNTVISGASWTKDGTA